MYSRRFCDACGNLLVSRKTPTNSFEFQCMRCKKTRPSIPEDSLIYRDQKTNPISKYSMILKNILDDPLNPKERKKCPKCKFNMSKNIRLNTILINACMKCKYRWIGE